MRSLAEARVDRGGSADPGPQSGELLAGRYRVEGVLGTGGMGRVVAARDEQNRPVAIKVLLSPPSERVWVERFFREARAVSRISSHHVIKVLSVSSPEDETPFIVMERLKGRDFGKRLRAEGPLNLRDVADCVVQACDAIAHSHQLGIVHRDVKPSNLFDHQNPDGSHIVKVLDFGISKARGQEEFEHTLTTSRDGMLGSPPYMSPEHIRDARSVDHRTDLWSMGIVAYQLLAGRLPFDGQSVGEVFCAVLERRFTPLSAVRPDLPPAIEAIVNKCLAREPGDRYQSAAELARAFAPFASPRLAGLVAKMPTATPQVSASLRPRSSPTPIPNARLDGELHTLTLPPVVPQIGVVAHLVTPPPASTPVMPLSLDEAPPTEPSILPITPPIDPVIITTPGGPFDDLSAASLVTAKQIRGRRRGVILASVVAVAMFVLMALPFVLSSATSKAEVAPAAESPAPAPRAPAPPALEALPAPPVGPVGPAVVEAHTPAAQPVVAARAAGPTTRFVPGRPKKGAGKVHAAAPAPAEPKAEAPKAEAPAARPELHRNPYND